MSYERRSRSLRFAGCGLILIVAAAVTVACQPEPGPEVTQTSTSAPTPSLTPRPGGSSPTPIETEAPDASFELPEGCEALYSPAMLETLEADNPPLNHPEVTMLSTQNVDLIDIIESDAPTLRCSWGEPSEYGLATNVTVVDDDQSAFIGDELRNSGFECAALGDGTICRTEQKGVTLDDEEYAGGETHYLGGGGWVTTAWINFSPEGYTEDIVATLWG
ncbi:hypothetical protein [Microbacterium sp. CFBP9034]|uniref:hypothetical protein n=1 Tax=Microbacterium sp. CFBP9034 TaxID=3096540 RepID=UPI002A69B009|nr:hypothetical protein [Microbacterium sp. CFBP9034]MDY0909188.1 hypothetical protein [Microbacterium sp. CFBP9034]